MQLRRWPQTPPPFSERGIVVHGAATLVHDGDTVVGVRSVTAYTTGLGLVLAGSARPRPPARELQSAWEAAVAALQQTGDEDAPDAVLDLRLLVTVDDVYGPAESWTADIHYNPDGFAFEVSFWIDHLPADRCLKLHVSWPALHLAELESTLTLAALPPR